MRVVVSQPVHQHSYQVALAAQEEGWLENFSTLLYRTGRGLSSPRILALLPTTAARQMDRLWRKRYHSELDPDLVDTHTLLGIFAFACRSIPIAGGTLQRQIFLMFDRVIASDLEQTSPDVVHGFEGTSLHTLRTARRVGAKAVLDVAGSAENYLRVLALSKSSTSHVPYGRLLLERSAADVLLAPSTTVIEGLSRAGIRDDRIVLCPFGVDVQRFRPGPGLRDGCRFLFVGKIGLRKGVPLLLKAWEGAVDRMPDAELILVGPTDSTGTNLLKHLPSRARWIGQVPRHAVHELFRSSDVFVLPSFAEGSALVTYEAMASGLPIITTKETGSVAKDGTHGRILSAGDLDGLIGALREIYASQEKREAWGAAARALIEDRFTWDHYRRRIRQVWSR